MPSMCSRHDPCRAPVSRFSRISQGHLRLQRFIAMTDPVPQKPRLYLPIRSSEKSSSNVTGGDRGSRETEAAANLGSSATRPPVTEVAASPISVLNSDGNGTWAVTGSPTLQEKFLQLQKQQQQEEKQQGVPFDRIFPPNVQVVREEDQGLATGMFCPLCLGDLYQFLISEKRGFVMCPDRQVVNPSPVLVTRGLNSNLMNLVRVSI